MASEGPYSVVGHPHGGVGIVGPGNDGSYCGMARYQAEEFVGNLNKAYAEGRKSAEKEFSEKENHEMKEKCSASWNSGFDQCMQLMKRELGWQEAQNEKRENEFNDLLDLANNLRKFAMGNFEPEAKEFDAWKKARGIE